MKSKPKIKLKAEGNMATLSGVSLDRITVTDVLQALAQNGIEDLEQLVKAQIDSAKMSTYKPDSLNLYALPADTPGDPAYPIVHRRPEMPVLVDGVLYDPADINRFDGQPLHFLVKPNDDGSAALLAYTGSQWTTALRTYFQLRDMLSAFDVVPVDFSIPGPPTAPNPITPPPIPLPAVPGSPGAPKAPSVQQPPSSGNPQSPSPLTKQPPSPPLVALALPPPPTESQFFSDANFGGDWMWLGPHLAWNDLTRVPRARFLVFSSNWNDVISSLRTWVGTVTLYEDINRGGSSITFPPANHIPDLGPSGWNDRVSSIVNWG